MAESLFPTFVKIRHTPMRDIVRLRLSGRLDWKSQLSAANLPVEARELISRVVGRTRLFRLEKVSVAAELSSHFTDGLEAGTPIAELVNRFGDEHVAAKLIRRAKRRGRPLLWHVWNFCFRAAAVFIAIYIVLVIRFCVGKPTPKIDYVAQMNLRDSSFSQSEKAWPLWRRAILATSSGMEDGHVIFPREIGGGHDPYATPATWEETANWLANHANAVELARQAGTKPALGFVYGAGGSANDSALFGQENSKQTVSEPLIALLLPHMNYLRMMATLLSFDAKLAASTGDGLRCQKDLQSLMGLSRQLRQSGGLLISDLVGLGIDGLMVERLQSALLKYPNALTQDQLIELAHEIAQPKVAGDLIDLQSERNEFHDIVQRLFTDDGHGDGHMTLEGMRSTMTYITVQGPTGDPWVDGFANTYALASPLPMTTVSRAELIATYDRIIDRFETALSLPIRQVNFEKINEELNTFQTNTVDKARYGPLLNFIPRYSRVQTTCERYLGQRDGAMVAISLELFHRRHRSYPDNLDELVPVLLPAIPADRITGNPIKYRLIDGKPVVYSVGADGIDDGGKPGLRQGKPDNFIAAGWSTSSDEAPHGDWVLYPPRATDDQ